MNLSASCGQLLWLVGIAAVAQAISERLPVPVPGGVIGLVALFALLRTGFLKPSAVDQAAGLLVRHLAFFFVPIAIGLMGLGETLATAAVPVFLVLLLSAVLGIVSAALATTLLSKRRAQP
ncbi:MAG TPA: CidA/LrgA family protein [Burkholderiales bacterium]